MRIYTHTRNKGELVLEVSTPNIFFKRKFVFNLGATRTSKANFEESSSRK